MDDFTVQKIFSILSEYKKPNGRSFYTVECPFCGNILNIQKWSFSSIGKKCNQCKAVLRKNIAYL